MGDTWTDYLASRGITTAWIVANSRLSLSTVRGLATAKHRPQRATRMELAKALNITVDQVLAMLDAEVQAAAEDPVRRALRLAIAACRAVVSDPAVSRGNRTKTQRRIKTLIAAATAAEEILSG